MNYNLIFKLCFLVAYLSAFQIMAQNSQAQIVAVDDIFTLSTPIEENLIPIDVLANDEIPDSAIVLIMPTEPSYGLAHWNSFTNTMFYVPFELGEEVFIDQFEYTIHICYVNSADTLFTNKATVTIKTDCLQDCVWTGDTNTDGRSNVWDILPIGLAYEETGPIRGVSNDLWIPQQANEWTNSLEVELGQFVNYKHIDANGDGTIDMEDISAIDKNYGLIHAKKGSQKLEDADFAIVLDFLNDSVSLGDTITAHIILSESGDTTDIYGLAFSINHNVEDSGTMQVNFPPSFIGDEDNTISLQKNLGNGRIEAAITRTDKKNTGGSGVFGVLSFVMEDFVDGKKKIAAQNIEMDILNVRAINSSGQQVPIIGIGDEAVVEDTSTGIESQIIDYPLNFYPNPVQNTLFIHLDDLQTSNVELINLIGEKMLSQKIAINQKTIELSLEEFNSGVYLLQVNTEQGIISKKILIF